MKVELNKRVETANTAIQKLSTRGSPYRTACERAGARARRWRRRSIRHFPPLRGASDFPKRRLQEVSARGAAPLLHAVRASLRWLDVPRVLARVLRGYAASGPRAGDRIGVLVRPAPAARPEQRTRGGRAASCSLDPSKGAEDAKSCISLMRKVASPFSNLPGSSSLRSRARRWTGRW